MPDTSLALTPLKSELGPLMQALTQKQRTFVIALFHNGNNRREAARLAGYSDTTDDTLDSGAYQAWQNEKVRKAAYEYGQGRMTALTPYAFAVLEELGIERATMDPKEKMAYAKLLLEHGGYNIVSEHKVTVEHVSDRREQIRDIIELAKTMGVDPKKLLGQAEDITDADYEIVDELTDTGRTGLEDLL